MMNRKWIHTALLAMGMTLLVGCGETFEEKMSIAIANAQTTFEQKPLEANTNIDQLSLHLPIDFTISEGETPSNYMIMHGTEQYLLFVNPLEEADSQLLYQLLKDDETKNIVKDQSFKQNDIFGFLAVIEHNEEQYELIVSIGGKKMTTMTSDKKVDRKIESMMEIVRSVSVKK